MPIEDAYSSGHLVLSHFVTCMCSYVETNLSWNSLVVRLLSFGHSPYFCFAFDIYFSESIDMMQKELFVFRKLNI